MAVGQARPKPGTTFQEQLFMASGLGKIIIAGYRIDMAIHTMCVCQYLYKYVHLGGPSCVAHRPIFLNMFYIIVGMVVLSIFRPKIVNKI